LSGASPRPPPGPSGGAPPPRPRQGSAPRHRGAGGATPRGERGRTAPWPRAPAARGSPAPPEGSPAQRAPPEGSPSRRGVRDAGPAARTPGGGGAGPPWGPLGLPAVGGEVGAFLWAPPTGPIKHSIPLLIEKNPTRPLKNLFVYAPRCNSFSQRPAASVLIYIYAYHIQ
jgi:hypothetical protein